MPRYPDHELDCRGCADIEKNEAALMGKKPVDMINSPPHYTGVIVTGVVRGKFGDPNSPVVDSVAVEIEAIDVIEGLGLGFRLGAVMKYLFRAGKKDDRLGDLKKARWFLDREIAKSEKK